MDDNLKPKGVAYIPQMIAEQKERLRFTIERSQKAAANHKTRMGRAGRVRTRPSIRHATNARHSEY